MDGERTIEGFEVRLKPSGAGRFFSAAFLAFWLCGWAAGETFALWILGRGLYALLTGTPLNPGEDRPLQVGAALGVGLFLTVWLTIWTVGGIAAIWTFLSMVWAEDRILARGGSLVYRWFRGPFRGTREFSRDHLRSVGLGPKGSLVVDTDRQRSDLSDLGTAQERRQAAEALRAELALPHQETEGQVLPKGWEEIQTPEGERAVVTDRSTRRVQAWIVTVVAAAMAGLGVAILQKAEWQPGLGPPVALTGLVTAALAWGASRLAFGRIEYRIGSGSITVRRRFRSSVRDLLEVRRLVVRVRTDSDGDGWFTLEGLSAQEDPGPAPAFVWGGSKDRRTIVTVIHDPTVPRLLGAWMARAANVPISQ